MIHAAAWATGCHKEQKFLKGTQPTFGSKQTHIEKLSVPNFRTPCTHQPGCDNRHRRTSSAIQVMTTYTAPPTQLKALPPRHLVKPNSTHTGSVTTAKPYMKGF
jgi:hypothetical protein